MIVKTDGWGAFGELRIISIRCPACRQHGSFTPFPGIPDVLVPSGQILGQRRCPNPSCGAHVFLIHDGTMLVHSYPVERLDFDSTGLPSPVLKAFEEAVTCHAGGCYIAAAIMVRKTLEELCTDRGAIGPNLKERIAALRGKIIVPDDLLAGVDDLRLLGNDAAHVESQVFTAVGKEEVEVGIDFAKELLKAVYQYSKLVDRLKKLKKP